MVILAVIAAAFAISYDPVRDIARAAGVQSWLVRIYPGVLDAAFLVACACALLLRQARWWNRLYAWFSVLVTGALIGAADVYHATGLRLPRRTMDGTVWALPWALVLLGFSLWLTTLPRSKPSGPDTGGTPEADAPVLALEGIAATRAALPAPSGNGGLAEVGFGEHATSTAAPAQLDEVPAHIEKGATDVEPRVAAEADPAETLTAEDAPEPHEPAESKLPVVPAGPREPAATQEAEDTARAEDTTQAEDITQAEDAAEPETAAPAEPVAESDEAAQAGQGAEPAEAREAEPVAEAHEAPEAHEVAATEGGTGAPDEPEWPFEAGEPAEAKTPQPDPAVVATDDATPPYGFPAVSEQDIRGDQADRLPTLLSAPVPADAEPAPVPAEQPAPAPFERVRSTPTPPEE
jgi:hypothetical protein